MTIPLIKTLGTLCMAAAMTAASYVATAPLQPAMAQARGLPDFTDLVDQVGPSVVNIRTMEKVSARGTQGFPGDEDMLEFFKRFGLPMPNMPTRVSSLSASATTTPTGLRGKASPAKRGL